MARKGVDPVAYCGLSCNHCFLSEWCGSCRTEYNTCSFATCSPMEYALTQNAARKKVLTVAGKVQKLKAAKKVFTLLNMMVEMRLKLRHCL